jgi:pullulanase/glycogen debranching enzyme
MVSQGMVMLSQGQEYAHSKVIAQTDAPDENIGQMDHDSYAKDNETNWVDYDHIDINHDLVQYYQGLIKLRKQFKSFRQIDKEHITYLENENPFAIGFLVKKQDSHDPYDFIVLLNGSDIGNRFILPEGQWVVVANSKLAGVRPLAYKSTDIVVPPTSGMILKR